MGPLCFFGLFAMPLKIKGLGYFIKLYFYNNSNQTKSEVFLIDIFKIFCYSK